MHSPSFLNIHPREGKIREAVVAGIFYPAAKAELAAEVDRLVGSCGAGPAACPAILSPHGSLEYSGPMEAAAWISSSLRRARTIVIISPSHRSFESGIFIPESRVFSIPTAEFRVESSILRQLQHSSTCIVENDIPHLEEHGIEIQLVMAAHFFPKATIVPVIVSKPGPDALDILFASLHGALGKDLSSTLLVLSSNMAVSESAESCAAETQAFLEALGADELSGYLSRREDRRSCCGAEILAAFTRSKFSQGLKASVIGFSDSSAFGEEGDPVVGYSAVGFKA
jgi:MEMO1 family protein